LLSSDGILSPQVDVLVLKPSYPAALHHKKKYLATGVAAAFECKLTLRKAHIFEAMKNAAEIKRMTRMRLGTPYCELVTPPVFGLLSHSHSWGVGPESGAVDTIDQLLAQADAQLVKHPREMPDLLCVCDLATWVASKEPLADPTDEIDPVARLKLNPQGSPATMYMCHRGETAIFGKVDPLFKPLGVFIGELLVKLAWEDVSLRDIAGYFVGVEFSSAARGTTARHWPKSIYSPQLRRKLKLRSLKNVVDWDEWAEIIE
jgi:hypothetical protein